MFQTKYTIQYNYNSIIHVSTKCDQENDSDVLHLIFEKDRFDYYSIA